MKRLLLLLVFVFAFSAGYSQSLWTKTSAERLNALEKATRSSMPQEYQIYQLDFPKLKQQLQAAPSRDNMEASNVVIAFPNAIGKLENYRIYESSVMAPELAARHPEIQSYIGQGIDDPTAKIHFTTTVFGLHTMTLSGKGTSFIDPYTNDSKNYIVYNKSSIPNKGGFQCQVEDARVDASIPPPSTMASDGRFRTYRLAMACTIEYAAFHVNAAITAGTLTPTATLAQKKAAVLAAMNVTVARVNSIYEKDMSLRFQLVANNETIIFVDSDNFNNTNAPTLINQSQTVIDGAIGDANYDIGHTVSTGGGGLAGAGVCTTGLKARGITGSPEPVSDAYDIDFVAHEIGHQFGASHTFNGEGGNCTLPNPAAGDPGTRAAAFAVEPGSGTTVMAYAGICDAVNVQEHSDDYFHAVSIGQMVARIAGAGNCVAGVANGNTPPVIAALTNYTIPKGTAFVLKGSATDANGDALTYCWEQTNAGASAINPSATSTDSNPNFRSLSPSTSPNRYMPALPSVLAGNLATTWEVIPNVARVMSFALTVRDNRAPNGGQTARQNMTVTFNDATGPFKVTSQSVDGISWTQGQTETITWDVAGTTGAPINTANVNILLSTDNGVTFSTLLANTPNDGSQAITVPNTAAPLCRIIVEAVGNIYYAVNAKTFSIGYTLQNICTTYTNSTVMPIPDGPDPNNPVAGPTLTSTINVPDTGVITDVNVRVNVTHQWIRDLTSIVRHPDGTQVNLGIRICNGQSGYNILFNDGSPDIVCAAPVTSGTFRPTGLLSTLNNKGMTGNWQLLINDYFQVDTGNLNSWSVEICRLSAVLNTPNFGLADFKIYPNPNKGNFNVQFNSESGNEIKINVHDISGRLIFNKTYQNTGLFSENLQLNNVGTGVYLVNVVDGDRKEVKKIVIE